MGVLSGGNNKRNRRFKPGNWLRVQAIFSFSYTFRSFICCPALYLTASTHIVVLCMKKNPKPKKKLFGKRMVQTNRSVSETKSSDELRKTKKTTTSRNVSRICAKSVNRKNGCSACMCVCVSWESF